MTATQDSTPDAPAMGAADDADDAREGGADGSSSRVIATKERRPARTIAIVVGIVLIAFIVVLATRQPPGDRFGPNPLIDRAAPVVVGTSLTGERVDIDKFRGKWVIVNFFQTTCVPCRIEHPELVKFANQHDALGDAQVVSVAFQDTTEALRTFFETNGGTWPVLVGDTGQIAIDYGVTGVPESFVVDPRGRVVAHFEGVTAEALNTLIISATAPVSTTKPAS